MARARHSALGKPRRECAVVGLLPLAFREREETAEVVTVCDCGGSPAVALYEGYIRESAVALELSMAARIRTSTALIP
jgi:hypothetical protein